MDGIHVSVRLRPLSSSELSSGIRSCCAATSKSSLMITKEGDSTAYLKSQAASDSEFAFDAVFDEHASQIEVYNKSARPYVEKVIVGENVTIFAYGATGAGKTHTMFGNTRFDSTAAFAGAGIIPQAVADLFRLLGERQENGEKGEAWTVAMSYMEVYNEQVCDLLEISNKNLPLREDPDRGVVIVAGLSEFKVSSYAEVLELLMKGQVNRKTEATKANIVSSRSHAILQFTITHTRRVGTGSNATTEAKLSLIDLAGSERASATQNTGTRLQEGANINKSLLALANCINALSERSTAANLLSPRKGKKTNVKYRDSKLTHLLKGSLEGNCNLVMIANVNPADSTYDDTYRTLQYANRAKNLKVKPCAREIGTEATAAEREMRLKEENEDLRLRLVAMEQNAQASNQSEQQLLQALAQALEALNAAKAQSGVAESIAEKCNHHMNSVSSGVVPSIPMETALPDPALTSSVAAPAYAPPAAPSSVAASSTRSLPAIPAWSSPKAASAASAPAPSPAPVKTCSTPKHAAPAVPAWSSPKAISTAPASSALAFSAAPAHAAAPITAPAAISSPAPASPMRNDTSALLSGKKTKRDSAASEDDRLSFSYNLRSSTGSRASLLIYGADGEGDEENVPMNERRDSEVAKSRRTSLTTSPCGRASIASVNGNGNANTERGTRLSSSSAASGRMQTRLSNSSVNGNGAASTTARGTAAQAPSNAAAGKPKRLSEELMQQYGVLANVTAAAIRRVSNADNTFVPASESQATDCAPFKPGRGSFPSSVTGINLDEPSDASKITIDARYRYSHGSRDATPPKQGFLSRFLCGIKRR